MDGGGLLGVWHPDGPAGRTVVVDEASLGTTRADSDTAIAVRTTGRRIDDVRRRLERRGLTADAVLVVFPGNGPPEHAVALDETIRWTGTDVLEWRPMASSLVSRLLVGPFAAIARRALRTVVVLGLPPTPTRWSDPVGRIAAASRSPRTDAVTATLRCGGGRGPEAFVQVGLDRGGDDRVERARTGLRDVASTAALAGIVFPSERPGPSGTLTTTTVPGRVLATQLRRDRGLLASSGAAAVEAIVRWKEASAVPVDVAEARALFDERSEDAAVVGRLDAGLGSWCHGAIGAALDRADALPCSVPVHGDLTTWNVLTTPAGGVGIVDWESSHRRGIPMLDLWYLLADLSVTTGVGRVAAVRSLRAGTPSLPPAVASAGASLERALGIDAELGHRLFDVAWIGPAADEVRRGVPGPFLDVVRALAQTSSRLS